LVATTLGLTVWLLSIDPFARVNAVLDAAFAAAPAWTQVSSLVRDPRTQEVSHGEHPAQGLRALAAYWRERPTALKAVLLGNSQMFAMSLAPGEARSREDERTYPDIVAAHFAPRGVLCYRLAAPGLSYSEALWYVDFLLTHPGLRPDVLLVQVNYQAFWNGGVRSSFAELLEDAAFRRQVETRAQSDASYAEDFRGALAEFDRGRGAAAAGNAAAPAAFGRRIEDATRLRLDRLDVFRRRAAEKDSFDEMLYRGRLYLLGIKPSTARSISGPRLIRNQEALDALANACEAAGVKLVVFKAPVNPRVSLYASDADRIRFERYMATLPSSRHLKIVDFEHAVPADLWGRQYNSPDPLHMGRRAHGLVAAHVIVALSESLVSGQ
jgi:hypothetical protein